jgi:Icc-related predicted phosphoesterase
MTGSGEMTIQIKRGLSTNMPTLYDGQPGYAEDTQELWVGTPNGNVNVSNGVRFKTLEDEFNALLSPATLESLENQNLTLNAYNLGYVDDKLVPINESLAENAEKVKPTKQKWVITADSQPKDDGQLAKWKSVRDHIRDNQSDAELMIFAGDIVNHGDGYQEVAPYPYTYNQMLDDLRDLSIPRSKIFAITGNHDIDYNETTSQYGRSWRSYLTAFERQYYYTIQGNILTIYMGAMARNTAGNIPDYVVDWWKELVRKNQDKVIVTVTHQPLQHTVTGSDTVGGSQLESSRFLSVLGTPGYRVDAWYSGHSGLDLNNPTVPDHVLLQGCMFIDVDMNSGYSDDDTVANFDSSYVTMEFEHKSKTITFKRWNVPQNVISKTWTITIPNSVELANYAHFDGRYQHDAVNGIIPAPQTIAVPLERVFNATTQLWEPSKTPSWGQRIIVEDRRNDDSTFGQGSGTLYFVPGSYAGGAGIEEPSLNRAYGVGAGVAAKRTYEAEDNYSSGLSIWVSGASRDETSLLEAVFIDETGRVGIGKTSGLSQAIHVSGGTSLTYLRLENTGATNNFDIGLGNTNDGFIRLRTPGTLRLYSNDVNRVNVTDTSLNPNTDNTYSLGKTSNRFSQLYAGTATINTSDERVKQDWTTDLSPELRAWGKVEYGKYRFIDAVEEKGDEARWHFGLIAQRVKEAFESEGLDPFAYGVLCYDEWDEQLEIQNEDGEIMQDYQASGNRYGIRYEEALALECAYLRSKIASL